MRHWIGVAAVVVLYLVTFIYMDVRAAEESQPLTTTERLALSSLNERGRVLQEDTRAFYTEACTHRGIKIEECSIDPTAMTITHKLPAPPPATSK